jgi:polysaccharide export outer membrane protein
MRVTRSLLLFLTIAIVAAGCASQPVVPYGTTPYATAPYATTPNGIDAVTYGTPAPAAYAPGYAPGYGQTYAPGYQQSYATDGQRGLFATYAQAPYGYPPTYAAAPARTPTPVPSYTPGATYAYAGTAVTAPTTQSAYTLDSGDRLRVVVFGQDGLSNSYSVDASGHIAMPLIGSVTARGATTDQLASRIADKLRDGYVRDPHVAVEIEAYRPFFILGEVTAPGQYPYVANMTAETAIAIAGGFGPRAFRDTVILNRTYNGQTMRMTIPLSYPLRPGDTVNVQERWF